MSACAYAVAGGPLDPDNAGQLLTHDWVEESYVAEDSIQCDKHPDAIIHWDHGDGWRRWMTCPKCKGAKKVPNPRYAESAPYMTMPCEHCRDSPGISLELIRQRRKTP